jgi:hypothetical protein
MSDAFDQQNEPVGIFKTRAQVVRAVMPPLCRRAS